MRDKLFRMNKELQSIAKKKKKLVEKHCKGIFILSDGTNVLKSLKELEKDEMAKSIDL